ncbi:uncharacterized protein LOC128928898 [Callithrix jacchus]|uniref:translation initiation factor IF-2-like n=1 Tax=Callithrix jacchus TaxID=9483 RepID=UPI0023DD020B|nr:translation initiation factor IF-2-like [Callithrix jacchus]
MRPTCRHKTGKKRSPAWRGAAAGSDPPPQRSPGLPHGPDTPASTPGPGQGPGRSGDATVCWSRPHGSAGGERAPGRAPRALAPGPGALQSPSSQPYSAPPHVDPARPHPGNRHSVPLAATAATKGLTPGEAVPGSALGIAGKCSPSLGSVGRRWQLFEVRFPSSGAEGCGAGFGAVTWLGDGGETWLPTARRQRMREQV